jgi:hypothetical protein
METVSGLFGLIILLAIALLGIAVIPLDNSIKGVLAILVAGILALIMLGVL